MESDADDLNESLNGEASGENLAVYPGVTPELFREWRSPRSGRSNPERMNNPVWEWLIKSGLSAYAADQRLDGPSPFEAGPGWCFDRFGQSSTTLPDGRVVLIGGEHEDSYDPDFYIYNDLVVRHPDGRTDIFGYPDDIFPPTDFHSATLVGNQIVIIGCLGYPDQRRHGTTPVFVVDLNTFHVSARPTFETSPGWIHKHRAVLSANGDSIVVSGGKIDPGNDRTLVENIDDWRLNLSNWRWERLTERRWLRWEVRRKDREPNRLWQIEQMLWASRFPGMNLLEKLEEFGLPSLEDELGAKPDLELLELYKRLCKPEVPHEEMAEEEEEEYKVHRIKIAGVTVRYVQDTYAVQLTIEGELPEQTVNALTSDLLAKFSTLEEAPSELIRL